MLSAMNITIDRFSDRPMYKQIADSIRNQIISGELSPDATLPAAAKLADDLRVSLNSVKGAMDLLRTEGLIVSARGRPTRVRPIRIIGTQRYEVGKRNYGGDPAAFEAEHGVPWADFHVTRQYRIVAATPRVALALGLMVGEDVYERQFTHATDASVLRLSYSYLAPGRFAGTILTDPDEPLWPGGTIGQLRAIGIDVTLVRTEVSAREATADEVRVLHLDAGAHVLESWRRMLVGNDAVALETAQHIYPSDGRQVLSFDIPVRPVSGPPSEWVGWSGPAYD